MVEQALDPFGIDANTLTELVDKQLTFSFTSGYIELLKRHGIEREDVVQSILEQLIRDKSDYDSEKGKISTFVATITAHKLHRMAREAMSGKRKAQHLSYAVSIHSDTPVELLELFGTTPDHAGCLRIDHVRTALRTQYSAEWISLFLEYTICGYSFREMTERHPKYNHNKLQRQFRKMRETAKEVMG